MDGPTQEEETLSCSICLETMREPKVLPCLHRFCESCLDNHIIATAKRAAGAPAGFSCPHCREFVRAPDWRKPPSAWADGFRTDFLLKDLIELYWSRQEHKNNEPQISHPCLEHADTEVDLYCYDCSQTVCHLCVATAHHNCNRLVTVKKAAQDYRSLMQEKIDQIHSIIEKALTRKTVQDRYIKEVHEKVMLVDTEIRKSALKLQEHINGQKELLLKELHEHYDVLQQNVSADALKLTDSFNKLQNLVKKRTLKIASMSDTDFLLLASIDTVVNSYNRACIALNKQYDTLCERISDVKCRFESVRSPYITLGKILFQSDSNNRHSSGDTTPSVLQNARFTSGPASSPSSYQTVMSAHEPMLSSSGSQTLQMTVGPTASTSGSQTKKSTLGPKPSASTSQTTKSTLEPVPSTSTSQTTKSTLEPVPSTSTSQTTKSTLGQVPSASTSQTIKSTLEPVPSTSTSQTTKSTLGQVPSASTSQTIKSTLRPVPSASTSQTIKSTLRPVPSTSVSQSAMSTQEFVSRVPKKSAKYSKTSKVQSLGSFSDTSDDDSDRPLNKRKQKV